MPPNPRARARRRADPHHLLPVRLERLLREIRGVEDLELRPFLAFLEVLGDVRLELLLQQVVVRLFLVFVIADQGDHLLFPSRGLLDLPLHGGDAFPDLLSLLFQGSDFRHGGLELGLHAADFIAPGQGLRGDLGIRFRIPGRDGGVGSAGLRDPLFQIRNLLLRADDFRNLLGIPFVQLRQLRLPRRQFDLKGLDRIPGSRSRPIDFPDQADLRFEKDLALLHGAGAGFVGPEPVLQAGQHAQVRLHLLGQFPHVPHLVALDPLFRHLEPCLGILELGVQEFGGAHRLLFPRLQVLVDEERSEPGHGVHRLFRLLMKEGQGERLAAVPACSTDNVDLDALAHHREQFLGAQLLSLLLEQAELVHHLRQRRAAHHLLLDRPQLLFDLEADRGAHVILRDALRDDEDREARFVQLRRDHAVHAGGEQDGEYREDDQPLPAEEELAVFPQLHSRSKGHPVSLIPPGRGGNVTRKRTGFRAGYRP